MNTIVAPVNFSVNSHNAAKYAADMAMAMKADLQLIHVLEIPMNSLEVPTTEYFMEELQMQADMYLKKLKDELTLRTMGELLISTALELGGIELRLEEFCRKLQPFIVVMGVSRDSMEGVLVGNRTNVAVNNLPFPLIVVPGDAVFHSFKKIVLACDPTDLSSDFYISYIRELKQIFNTNFEVIHIIPEKGEGLEIPEDSFLLNTWNKKLSEFNPEVRFIRVESVEVGIQKYLYQHQADLLVVFPKNHNFFEFHRSNSKRIARQSQIPVLSIHA
jgi:nucleotide-binding universal stress UspA family protein